MNDDDLKTFLMNCLEESQTSMIDAMRNNSDAVNLNYVNNHYHHQLVPPLQVYNPGSIGWPSNQPIGGPLNNKFLRADGAWVDPLVVEVERLMSEARTTFTEPVNEMRALYESKIRLVISLTDELARLQDETLLKNSLNLVEDFDTFIRIQAIKGVIAKSKNIITELFKAQVQAAERFYTNEFKK